MTPAAEPGRAVDQRAVQLFDGHAGLHEIGIDGSGQLVGLLDDDITMAELEPFVARRTVSAARRRRPGPTHGDRMATALVQAAPGCRLVTAGVFDDSGWVLREAIRNGAAALYDDPHVRLINVSLEIRQVATQCTPLQPCVACSALRRGVDEGRIIVVSAGNRGELDGTITCPAAESGALRVAATTGPAGSSGVDPSADPHTETGTSVAAAMTTGGIALLLHAFPDLTITALEAALALTSTRLAMVPEAMVTHGRPHYFRAFRAVQHGRNGGTVDIAAAERIGSDAVATLAAEPGDVACPAMSASTIAERVGELRRAISFAPWSAELHAWLGRMLEPIDPGVALQAAAESIRLDWKLVESHWLLSRLLRSAGDDFGARVEQSIAEHLRDGHDLGAADILFSAVRQRGTGEG